MSVTMMGDSDMTRMRDLFVKPQATIADELLGRPDARAHHRSLHGSAISKLETTSFALRTALLK